LKRPSLLTHTLVVMSGYLLTKLMGLVREPLITRAFGAGESLDAYYAAFNLPDLLHTLMAGGALTTILIPLFTETLTQRGKDEAWRFASAVINLVVLGTALFAALIVWFAHPLVGCCLAPGFSAEQQALTADLMRLILLSTIIFALAGVLMGLLNAQHHFASPAFAPALYNLGIIGGAVFLAPRFGVYGLAYGVIIGSLLHLASHFPPLFHQGVQYRFSLAWRDPLIAQMLRLMGPRVLALGVVKLNTLVGTNLASQLSEGSVTALNLAWLVMQIPETIIATAIGIVVFPTLSHYAVTNQLDKLCETMTTALRAILLLSVPALLGLLLLGKPIVQLLFQGGRFSAEATDAVVWALQFYALALLGHSFLEVATRVFYARKDTRTPLLAAVLAMLLNLVLAFTLVTVLAHGGIALANALAVSVEVGLLGWFAQRQLHGIGLSSIVALAVRATIAGVLMGAIIALTSSQSPIIALLMGGVASGVYFVGLWAMGVEEVRGMIGRLRRRVIETRNPPS
jgi:putative peptidoglycan lipid II flippase